LVLLLGGTTAMAKEPPKVEIVGHRGASYDAPENTLAAIRLGWEQNADAVEFDVYLSKDGQIVLIHDADTERVAGVKRKIVEQTTEELRQLDVGKWKHAKYTGEKIPLLSEALATIPPGKRVFIEVKCGPEIVPELKRQLALAKRPAAETAIISFQKDVIAECKKTIPTCKAYWLASIKRDKKTNEWNHTVDDLIQTGKELHADGLDLSACDLIDKSFGDKVKASGLELLVWTVNDAKVAKQMVAAGVQGITTDRPEWLRAELAKPE
jgi:glycerophosphoryl diester phosphodiesterase